MPGGLWAPSGAIPAVLGPALRAGSVLLRCAVRPGERPGAEARLGLSREPGGVSRRGSACGRRRRSIAEPAAAAGRGPRGPTPRRRHRRDEPWRERSVPSGTAASAPQWSRCPEGGRRLARSAAARLGRRPVTARSRSGCRHAGAPPRETRRARGSWCGSSLQPDGNLRALLGLRPNLWITVPGAHARCRGDLKLSPLCSLIPAKLPGDK